MKHYLGEDYGKELDVEDLTFLEILKAILMWTFMWVLPFHYFIYLYSKSNKKKSKEK